VNQTAERKADILAGKRDDIHIEKLESPEELLDLFPELHYLNDAKELCVR